MRLRKFILLAVAPVLVAVSLSARAEEPAAPQKSKGDVNVKINIDPKAAKLDEEYKNATKNLSKEQTDKLKALDAAYAKVIEPSLLVATVSVTFDHCLNEPDTEIAKAPARYTSEQGVFRVQQWSHESNSRQAFDAQLPSEVPFVDKKIIIRHEIFQGRLMEALSGQILEANYKTAGFKKEKCAEIAKKLDDSFTSASAVAVADVRIPAGKLEEIQRSADSGNPDGVLTLGMLYLQGDGVERDQKKGAALITQAAEKGYARAQMILGLYYGTDMFSGAKDMDKAKLWLGKAAEQGNDKAKILLRDIDHQPPHDSVEEAQKKAEAGNAEAQYDLATRYRDGSQGAGKDLGASLKWFLLAAGQGYPYAESDLSMLLFKGTDKTSEAIEWMTLAAQHGVSNSQYELASIYLLGKIVPRDPDRALFWFKKAAERGESRSIEFLKRVKQQ
jgi:TPR repeat protein